MLVPLRPLTRAVSLNGEPTPLTWVAAVGVARPFQAVLVSEVIEPLLAVLAETAGEPVSRGRELESMTPVPLGAILRFLRADLSSRVMARASIVSSSLSMMERDAASDRS